MEQIKILYMHGGTLARGGTEAFMMNTFRNVSDFVHIDFLVHGFEEGIYDAEIKAKGSKVFYVPIKSKDYFGNVREIKRILKEGNYDIVHAHLNAMNGPVLKIAKQMGVPIRISHSHASKHYTTNKIKLFLNNRAMKKIPHYATELVSCSDVAGKFLYGNHPFKVLYNAIDVDKYAFNLENRAKIRAQYNLGDAMVFGHIGRFNFQKNHHQLINIFAALHAKTPNSKLVLVGEGELLEDVKSQISKMGLDNAVVFTGTLSNIDEMLSAFDCFLLPSVFEGLPYVLVEAQANGLLVLASDTVDFETKISHRFFFLDPNNIEAWLQCFKDNYLEDRSIDREEFSKRGFVISEAAAKLEYDYINQYLMVQKGELA